MVLRTVSLLIIVGGASPVVGAWWNSVSSAAEVGTRFSVPSVSSANGGEPLSTPVSDLKVFLNLDCLVKANLFTSLSSAEAYEKQVEGQSCGVVRVPLFKEKSDRSYDNYAVVERRHGLTKFLEEICPRYDIHLITDKTKFVATAIMQAALSPMEPSHKLVSLHTGTSWVDQSGVKAEWRRGTDLPQILWRLYRDQFPYKIPEEQWARAVLVDSTMVNHVSRPANGILVPEFNGYKSLKDVEEDDALHVATALLQELEPNNVDVQKLLTERFNLPTRLQADHELFCAQNIGY
jgi:NLI interacting factor-like phosphatase